MTVPHKIFCRLMMTSCFTFVIHFEMTTSDRIPSLLSPYICLTPEASLSLVTSTVSTTANWVLLRYIYAALGGNTQGNGLSAANNESDDVGVTLVSWMRDVAFWKSEARRAVVSSSIHAHLRHRLIYAAGIGPRSRTITTAGTIFFC